MVDARIGYTMGFIRLHYSRKCGHIQQLIQCEGSPEPILGISLSWLALSCCTDITLTLRARWKLIYARDVLQTDNLYFLHCRLPMYEIGRAHV